MSSRLANNFEVIDSKLVGNREDVFFQSLRDVFNGFTFGQGLKFVELYNIPHFWGLLHHLLTRVAAEKINLDSDVIRAILSSFSFHFVKRRSSDGKS